MFLVSLSPLAIYNKSHQLTTGIFLEAVRSKGRQCTFS